MLINKSHNREEYGGCRGEIKMDAEQDASYKIKPFGKFPHDVPKDSFVKNGIEDAPKLWYTGPQLL